MENHDEDYCLLVVVLKIAKIIVARGQPAMNNLFLCTNCESKVNKMQIRIQTNWNRFEISIFFLYNFDLSLITVAR